MSTFKISILIVIGAAVYFLNFGAVHKTNSKDMSHITIPETVIKE